MVLSVVAVIAFVVYIIFRRRRHQAKQNPNPEIESNPTYSLGKGPITGAPSGSTLVAASYSRAASASHPQLNAMGDSSTYLDQYLSKPELPADFITPIPKIPEGQPQFSLPLEMDSQTRTVPPIAELGGPEFTPQINPASATYANSLPPPFASVDGIEVDQGLMDLRLQERQIREEKERLLRVVHLDEEQRRVQQAIRDREAQLYGSSG